MAKNTTQSRVPKLWGDQIAAPRADVTTPGDGARKLAVYKAAAYIALFGVPLMILLNILVLNKSVTSSSATGAATTSGGAASSPGRAVALLKVASWLAQVPAPLPGGLVLSWDGATTVATQTTTDSSAAPIGSITQFSKAEIDSFTVLDGKGLLYNASVEVAIDTRPGGGAQVVSGVSLVPQAPAATDGWANGIPWPGLTKDTEPSPVDTAIQSWASAYTSGDASTLGQAVRDPDSGHAYVPLRGVASVTSTPVVAAYLDPTKKTTMLVQATLDISWTGAAATDPAVRTQSPVPTTIDLLVQQADTAAPVVVAWGAPGSGLSLTPYVNAVSTAAPRALPSATPSGVTSGLPSRTVSSPAPRKSVTPPPVPKPTATKKK